MPNKKKSYGSKPLPKGEAKRKYERFKKSFPDNKFPGSVCYTIEALRNYLDDAEATLIKHNVPANERGIALILGLNDNDGTHAANRITIMLVATAFTEDDNCKVLTIDNPVTGSHGKTSLLGKRSTDGDGEDDDADTSFDVTGVWP